MLEILLLLSPQEIESQGWHFASQTLKIVVQLQVLAQILVSCPRPAERLDLGAGLDSEGASDSQTDMSALFKLCTFAVLILNTWVFRAAWMKGQRSDIHRMIRKGLLVVGRKDPARESAS